MPSVDVVVECPVFDSFRVQQVAGMFDVPIGEKATERFEVELPEDDQPWQVGLIVGPSGSGKSTIAKEFYSAALTQKSSWPRDRAVVDCFDGLSVRHVIELFTAVGFGSAPAWIKPYHVLSCGQQFRCDLARALSQADFGLRKAAGNAAESARNPSQAHPADFPLVVFDEFTSVVDRQVAKATSTAIAKGIRAGTLPCRFIAVTCHYDVAPWLEADWVLDMATGALQRRCLRRPPIQLEIHRCRRTAWQLFAKHHYLTTSLPRGARCYLATWAGEPVTFCATLPLMMKKNHRRFGRIVTLPDYQGMGIGMRVVAAVAALHRSEGHRINVTSSHPALIHHCRRSPYWKAVGVKKMGSRPSNVGTSGTYRGSYGRAVVSFEYFGQSNATTAAQVAKNS
ncbi:MAG: GNAT family N-acetyltransferase [Bythopirellula sp.]